jgi:hypothetical protein
MAVAALVMKPAPSSFPPGEPSFDQAIKSIGFTFIIC